MLHDIRTCNSYTCTHKIQKSLNALCWIFLKRRFVFCTGWIGKALCCRLLGCLKERKKLKGVNCLRQVIFLEIRYFVTMTTTAFIEGGTHNMFSFSSIKNLLYSEQTISFFFVGLKKRKLLNVFGHCLGNVWVKLLNVFRVVFGFWEKDDLVSGQQMIHQTLVKHENKILAWMFI